MSRSFVASAIKTYATAPDDTYERKLCVLALLSPMIQSANLPRRSLSSSLTTKSVCSRKNENRSYKGISTGVHNLGEVVLFSSTEATP